MNGNWTVYKHMKLLSIFLIADLSASHRLMP